ncbi:LuxR family transcriptional regulator [Eggerthella guodeyinii]|uniref:LuxR family transcriptional regulator n=1 Tax=Eggerthella guodeyinii TaxID=2690837 RepID=A0A6L7IWH3_9ACTN|nr:LuxR C-terminal-related transcriptional regulator [Eggerthella guodeyinii]QOS67559.1 LuxR family transcriptional regulator [Eggerthella guodeyinii]
MRFTGSGLGSVALDERKRAIAALVGLAVMGVWVNLVGYGGVFLEPSSTDSSLETTRYAYHAGRVAVSLLILVAPGAFERFGRGMRTYLPLVMCFCTAGFAIAFHQTLVAPVVLGVGASFVLGMGYLWIVASFYIALARAVPLRPAIVVALASQVIEQVLSVAASSALGATAQIVVCCACPLVALAALPRAWRKRDAAQGGVVADKARSHLYLLLVASGVAIVTLSAVSNVGIWGSARVEYVAEDALVSCVRTCLACVLLTAFALGTLVASADKPLGYRYQVPFLVIVGCFMLAVLKQVFPGMWSEPVTVVLLAAEFFSHILTWTLVMNAEKDLAGPSYFNAGMSLAPYSICSIGWIFLLETDQVASAFVVLAVSYALIIVVAVHPRLLYERRQRTLTSADALNEYTIEGEPEIPLESNGAAVVEVVDRRCVLLGERYGLSQRETQVLSLLAQGRSRPAIQRELVLSEGTVKTHVAHIYEKMGVGSRQEVFDIVYDAGVDGETAPASS